MKERCLRCGNPVGAYGGHGSFDDRGDGHCSKCGRTSAWHAGRSCFCRFATGMPAPVEVDLQLSLPIYATTAPEGGRGALKLAGSVHREG